MSNIFERFFRPQLEHPENKEKGNEKNKNNLKKAFNYATIATMIGAAGVGSFLAEKSGLAQKIRDKIFGTETTMVGHRPEKTEKRETAVAAEEKSFHAEPLTGEAREDSVYVETFKKAEKGEENLDELFGAWNAVRGERTSSDYRGKYELNSVLLLFIDFAQKNPQSAQEIFKRLNKDEFLSYNFPAAEQIFGYYGGGIN